MPISLSRASKGTKYMNIHSRDNVRTMCYARPLVMVIFSTPTTEEYAHNMDYDFVLVEHETSETTLESSCTIEDINRLELEGYRCAKHRDV
uniref:Uncharacterized protein n=1 Tax=Oryza barthii TaxID=65489 RepID=A0A0D3GN93_9ORYZ